MQQIAGKFGAAPGAYGGEELDYLGDIVLTRLARHPQLLSERRAFIKQHVNHPSHVGRALILGWARDLLDEDDRRILAAMTDRPRALPAPRPVAASSRNRWMARQAEIDIAAKADARLVSRVRREAAARREKDYNDSFATWAGLAVAIGLLLLFLGLMDMLQQQGRLEDCVLQGRDNCVPIADVRP